MGQDSDGKEMEEDVARGRKGIKGIEEREEERGRAVGKRREGDGRWIGERGKKGRGRALIRGEGEDKGSG